MTAFSTRSYPRSLAAGLILLVLGYPVAAAGPPAALAPESKFLPDNCTMVGVVRVEQLLGSEAYKHLKKESPRVARLEETIAAELPLPLDQIDRIVFGGGVVGEDEGLWVIHTRAKIDLKQVSWSKTPFDRPTLVKIGNYDLYRRRNESFALVADNLLVFGKESLLRFVLDRNAAPRFSASFDAALKDADLTATAAVGFDVGSIRKKRRGDALQFVPGLQMMRAEAVTNSLTLTAKLDGGIEIAVAAVATSEAGATTLQEEVSRFVDFHRTTLKDERNAPQDVLDIFKLKVGGEAKRVTASTKFSASSLAHFLKLMAQ